MRQQLLPVKLYPGREMLLNRSPRHKAAFTYAGARCDAVPEAKEQGSGVEEEGAFASAKAAERNEEYSPTETFAALLSKGLPEFKKRKLKRRAYKAKRLKSTRSRSSVRVVVRENRGQTTGVH